MLQVFGIDHQERLGPEDPAGIDRVVQDPHRLPTSLHLRGTDAVRAVCVALFPSPLALCLYLDPHPLLALVIDYDVDFFDLFQFRFGHNPGAQHANVAAALDQGAGEDGKADGGEQSANSRAKPFVFAPWAVRHEAHGQKPNTPHPKQYAKEDQKAIAVAHALAADGGAGSCGEAVPRETGPVQRV